MRIIQTEAISRLKILPYLDGAWLKISCKIHFTNILKCMV